LVWKKSKQGGVMCKKTAIVLVVAMIMTTVSPSVGISGHYASAGYGHYRHYPYHGHHYHGYGDDALFWGLTGLFLGTLFLSVALQPPPPQVPMGYVEPRGRIYSYPPQVPPGMCRWERYILDNNGRLVLDQYGQPVKEYTLGSCEYPPN